MAKRYRTILKWALYSLALVVVILLNTTVLGNRTFCGAKLSLLPVYAACVACREGHESGGIFALASALVWTLTGAEGGVVFVLLLPVAAVIAGFFCTAYFPPSLLPTLVSCLLALTLCEGGVYLQRLYMDAPMPPNALALLGYQIGFSLIPAPLLWLCARGIGKAGGK